MYSFSGKNPTWMYYNAVMRLLNEGDEVSPRGKLVKELRPAAVEFENPFNRVTFLGERKVNPFFQIAESLWILSGRADVQWLTQFNKNMAEFSDDGVWFNAPYGERIRYWNKNSAHGVIINPIDQLVDAYLKLLNDKDTRQAVVVISNPMFDNSRYTIGEKGKDIACNLIFTFKIRHDKLNMTVFNRSNDAHWGLWGANLCQFSTIQEVMLNWLKYSGKDEFKDLEVGTYTQLTDSLHIYVDTYGFKCTNDVLKYYETHPETDAQVDFSCKNEPRMSLSQKDFDAFTRLYWNVLNQYIMDDEYISNNDNLADLLELISDAHEQCAIDDYWYFGIQAMIAYRLRKIGDLYGAVAIIDSLQSCQWKVSMLYFLKNQVEKLRNEEVSDDYDKIVELYKHSIDCIANDLNDNSWESHLREYLAL